MQGPPAGGAGGRTGRPRRRRGRRRGAAAPWPPPQPSGPRPPPRRGRGCRRGRPRAGPGRPCCGANRLRRRRAGRGAARAGHPRACGKCGGPRRPPAAPFLWLRRLGRGLSSSRVRCGAAAPPRGRVRSAPRAPERRARRMCAFGVCVAPAEGFGPGAPGGRRCARFLGPRAARPRAGRGRARGSGRGRGCVSRAREQLSDQGGSSSSGAVRRGANSTGARARARAGGGGPTGRAGARRGGRAAQPAPSLPRRPGRAPLPAAWAQGRGRGRSGPARPPRAARPVQRMLSAVRRCQRAATPPQGEHCCAAARARRGLGVGRRRATAAPPPRHRGGSKQKAFFGLDGVRGPGSGRPRGGRAPARFSLASARRPLAGGSSRAAWLGRGARARARRPRPPPAPQLRSKCLVPPRKATRIVPPLGRGPTPGLTGARERRGNARAPPPRGAGAGRCGERGAAGARPGEARHARGSGAGVVRNA